MTINLSLEPRRTTWGAIVQTAAYTKTPIDFLSQTTLNEKYGVAENVGIDRLNDFPNLAYFGYGRGSTYMKVLTDESTENVNYLHEPVDAALYNQMPFILRTLDNDISPALRANYAMRALVIINGIQYIAYYLKALDKSDSVITASVIIPATIESNESSTNLAADTRYLNPTATEPTPGNIRTDGAYIRVSNILGSNITPWDIEEMINAKEILTGNSQLEITELGLFSAIQKTVTSSLTGTEVTYTEAIRAQLNLISPQRIMVNHYSGNGVPINHDLGVDDPTNFSFSL